MLEPSKEDLDSMIERRYIRMLVTFSKTNYFLDGPDQHGATYDGAKLFEEFLNKRLQSKHIRVQVAFIPVSRERLFPAVRRLVLAGLFDRVGHFVTLAIT